METSKRDTHISHAGLTSEGFEDPSVISSHLVVHRDHGGEQPQANMGGIGELWAVWSWGWDMERGD